MRITLALFFKASLSVVAMDVCKSRFIRPLESIAETQPQLQPALLRLSAGRNESFA